MPEKYIYPISIQKTTFKDIKFIHEKQEFFI